jgi:class 3 adenylate cyclase/tetratricopeptide (TPR) repeat protein
MTTSRESRRVVTVLFADLVSSTQLGEELDPEPLRAVLRRYFDVCRTVIERHGGTVEKFIGDAVMAGFGVPETHEDDALRAARAAVDLGTAVRELSVEVARTWPIELEVRVGVNTGEVMAAADETEETMVTGDAVNVAARLQSSAGAGEVWVGGNTERLIRDVADLEPLGEITVKGKPAGVLAFRLLAVRETQEVVRQLDAPLVGRQEELDRLGVFIDDITRSIPRLVTVLGPAGIGKSRLVRELLTRLGSKATVLRGRCLPYGQGITYWAIGEVVRVAATITTGDTREEARAKLRRTVEGAENADMIAERVATLIGLGDTSAPAEELAWAVRQLLAHLARMRPLVLVVDDIQWAEPELLDLLEQLVGLAGALPLLVLTMARPELLDTRPSWPSAVEIIKLEPLDAKGAEEQLNALIASSVVSAAVRDQVLESAEGNPLFVEQFVAMLRDEGTLEVDPSSSATVRVPPEIGALLAARLDHLPPVEQHVLECASVIGRTFWWGSVAHLMPIDEQHQLGSALTSLVRRGLLRPDVSTFVGDDAFRFHHLLLLDAAYRRIPKKVRGDLHARFAEWLDERTRDRLAEYQEIVAHHYLEAHQYYTQGGEAALALPPGERAFAHLLLAGSRALNRQDLRAVASLWGEAYRLPLPGKRRAQLLLLPDLSEAIAQTGRLDQAIELLQSALASSDAEDLALRSRLEVGQAALQRFLTGDITTIQSVADKWLPFFERTEDYGGMARAWQLRQVVSWGRIQVAEAERARKRVEEYAYQAGEGHLARRIPVIGAEAYGPSPAEAALDVLRGELAQQPTDLVQDARIRFSMAGLLAMVGDVSAARDEIRRCTATLDELGRHMFALASMEMAAYVELIAGSPARAEESLRPSIDGLRAMGSLGFVGGQIAILSIAVALQGRSAEAMKLADEADAIASPHDVGDHMNLDRARSVAMRLAGKPAEAILYIERALAVAASTDVAWIGDFHLEHARILWALHRTPEALEAADRAADAFGRKQYRVGEAATEAFRREVAGSPA